jgi:hypothetical protein
MNKAGLALLVLGAIIMIWGAFGFTTRDTIVNVGPIHATKDTQHNIPYGPLLGGVIFLGGVGLWIRRESSL